MVTLALSILGLWSMIFVMKKRITIDLPDMQRSSAYVKRNRLLIFWSLLLIVDLIVVKTVYQEKLSRQFDAISSPPAHYCKSVPLESIFNLLRPENWFLLASIVLVTYLAYKVIRAAKLRLRGNSHGLQWLYPILGSSLILLLLYLIANQYCGAR